jgi:hypothetical protein
VDAKNKVVQNEPPGKERMRGRFSVAPLIIFFFSKIIYKINGVLEFRYKDETRNYDVQENSQTA